MTTEMAIKILKPKYWENYDGLSVVDKASNIAVYALEKQLPKKPDIKPIIMQGSRIADELIRFQENRYECPTCGSFLLCIGGHRDEYSQFRHCPSCGQAIDWEGIR